MLTCIRAVRRHAVRRSGVRTRRGLWAAAVTSALISASVIAPTSVAAATVPGELCFGQRATLVGHGGVLRGTGHDDVIVLTVPTTVYAGGGGDVICGSPGPDTILSGAGADRVAGAGGPDRILGGEGSDILRGANGMDTILGRGGSDLIEGQRNGDLIRAGDGDDIAIGGRGQDRLRGDTGEDILSKRTGPGELDGGPGIDTFYFAHFRLGAHGSDFVPDFRNGSVLKLSNRMPARAEACTDSRFTGDDRRGYFSLEPGETALSGGPRGKGVGMRCDLALSVFVDNPFAAKSFMDAYMIDLKLSNDCFSSRNCIVWERHWPMKEGDTVRMDARPMNFRAWRDRSDGKKNAVFYAVMEPGSQLRGVR